LTLRNLQGVLAYGHAEVNAAEELWKLNINAAEELAGVSRSRV